jgi:hypothetical protein
MKRLIFWSALAIFVALPFAAIAALLAAIEDKPTVQRSAELDVRQVERAKRILKAHDPRNSPPGTLRTFSIAGDDLNLALSYLASQRGGGVKLTLNDGAAMLWTSIKLPDLPLSGYVNIEAVAHQTSTLPEFDRVQVGQLPVPGFIANWLLRHAVARLDGSESAQAALDAVRTVRFAPGYLVVEYQWQDDLPERLRAALMPKAEQERLRAYQEQLVAITASPALARQISLVDLIRPLMKLAAARSAGGEALAENRAALIVAAFYVNGRGLAAIVPGAKEWARAMPRKVMLAGRRDFAQHFTVSAAIAATAGSPLADVIGLYKEVEDSRGGSGFSFGDIAADRAGTIFGQNACSSAAGARGLQARIAAGLVESDMMPRADDFPEALSEAEFKSRFGGVGAPAHARMMGEIERRLRALALYR